MHRRHGRPRTRALPDVTPVSLGRGRTVAARASAEKKGYLMAVGAYPARAGWTLMLAACFSVLLLGLGGCGSSSLKVSAIPAAATTRAVDRKSEERRVGKEGRYR